MEGGGGERMNVKGLAGRLQENRNAIGVYIGLRHKETVIEEETAAPCRFVHVFHVLPYMVKIR